MGLPRVACLKNPYYASSWVGLLGDFCGYTILRTLARNTRALDYDILYLFINCPVIADCIVATNSVALQIYYRMILGWFGDCVFISLSPTIYSSGSEHPNLVWRPLLEDSSWSLNGNFLRSSVLLRDSGIKYVIVSAMCSSRVFLADLSSW